MPGACCYYGVCCPPDSPKAARQLADALGIDLEAAVKVLGRFRLVPRDIDAGVHEDLDRDLKVYLKARGLSVTGDVE